MTQRQASASSSAAAVVAVTLVLHAQQRGQLLHCVSMGECAVAHTVQGVAAVLQQGDQGQEACPVTAVLWQTCECKMASKCCMDTSE